MKVCMYNGSMWTFLEYEPININPIKLGGIKLTPGTIVNQIGTKNNKYQYLAGDIIYCGYTLDNENKKLLLFKPYELNQKRPSYICFRYEDGTMLTYGTNDSPYMVYANKIIIASNPKVIGEYDYVVDQIDIFDEIS